jgi:hypothetical protein
MSLIMTTSILTADEANVILSQWERLPSTWMMVSNWSCRFRLGRTGTRFISPFSLKARSLKKMFGNTSGIVA